MSRFRSTLVHAGGFAVVLKILIMVVVVLPFGSEEAAAQESQEMSSTSFGDILASGGLSTWVIILLGIVAAVLTLVGAIAVQKRRPWPHWAGLIRGLGEAAFLFGVLGACTGMIAAFSEITRLGAAVTPADMGNGVSAALVSVVFGAVVAIGTLIGGGIVRAFEPRPPEEDDA